MTLKMVFITTVFLGSLAAFITGLRRAKMLKIDAGSIKEAFVSTGNGIVAFGKKTMEAFASETGQGPK